MVIPSKETKSMKKPIVSLKTFSKGMYDLLPSLSKTLLHFLQFRQKHCMAATHFAEGETMRIREIVLYKCHTVCFRSGPASLFI